MTSDLFRPLNQTLQRLFITRVGLSSLSILHSLAALSFLDASRNQIADLGDNPLASMSGLRELRLSENLISSLHQRNLFGPASVIDLDVSRNRIADIDRCTFHDLRLGSLNLDGNPFTCDCSTRWLLDLNFSRRSTSAAGELYTPGLSLLCTLPPEAVGKQLSEVNFDACEGETTSSPLVSSLPTTCLPEYPDWTTDFDYTTDTIRISQSELPIHTTPNKG